MAHVIRQVINDNLQYSEQLGAGVPASVRGCCTNTAIGSKEILVSNEILIPAFGPSQLLGQGSSGDDTLQFGVFQD